MASRGTLSSSKLSADQLADALDDLSEAQFKEVQLRMRHRRPKVSNSDCALLKLPAEMLNEIYRYVAEDAHAACVTVPKKKELSDVEPSSCYALKDASGRKVRPGLMGACRQLYTEFHTIFYSPLFIKARMWRPSWGGWKNVENAAVLDAIVNEKHESSKAIVYDELLRAEDRAKVDYDHVVLGILESVAGEGPCVRFSILLGNPWKEYIGTGPRWCMDHTCRNLGTARHIPRRKDRCALCLLSMGPERARSEQTSYD